MGKQASAHRWENRRALPRCEKGGLETGFLNQPRALGAKVIVETRFLAASGKQGSAHRWENRRALLGREKGERSPMGKQGSAHRWENRRALLGREKGERSLGVST